MRELTYATVCSGIECMSVACRGLPLRPVFFSEIEPFPCAVLRAHYPDVPNLGDMSKIQITDQKEITNGTINIRLSERLGILAGGTPCQDVSVAGKRRGMAEGSNTRSSLAFEFVRLVRELAPRYVLWENVAGCIDSKNAPDFLRFANAIGECGYSVAWRVLDAQYVRVDGVERAVPQRRRRVWLVGCAGGDVRRVAQILFEPDVVAGDSSPRRRTGQGFAYSLGGRDCVDAGMVGGAPGTRGGYRSAIALDGDKLKPREDQRKGGNGFGVNEDGAGYTLTGVDRHGVAYKCFKLDSMSSNSMKSPNPHSGIHEVQVSGCLDATTPDPTKNQGGNVVVSSQGIDGYNKTLTGDVAPTISGAASDLHHVHGVVSTNSNGEDVAPTLNCTDLVKQVTGEADRGGGGYVITRIV